MCLSSVITWDFMIFLVIDNLRFCNHATLTIRSKISVQARELERSPTRVEIERELARDKNAPRILIPRSETSPSSRVSDALPEHDSDWRRTIEKNIERIMQHLQIPVVALMKAASAKSSSNSESTGTDTSRKPDQIQESIMPMHVQCDLHVCCTAPEWLYLEWLHIELFVNSDVRCSDQIWDPYAAWQVLEGLHLEWLVLVARRRAGMGFSGEPAPYKFVGGTLTSALIYEVTQHDICGQFKYFKGLHLATL